VKLPVTLPLRRRPGAVLLLLYVCWSGAQAEATGAESIATGDRELSFVHTHTGKSVSLVYFRNGAYVPQALETLNRFLSDFRSGEVVKMDPRLFDILYQIKMLSGTRSPFQVISAFRSPGTNEMLRSRSKGVARNSQHVLGKAIDIRLADVNTKRLRELALSLKAGGVGYYPDSDFVHVDTGRVRKW